MYGKPVDTLEETYDLQADLSTAGEARPFNLWETESRRFSVMERLGFTVRPDKGREGLPIWLLRLPQTLLPLVIVKHDIRFVESPRIYTATWLTIYNGYHVTTVVETLLGELMTVRYSHASSDIGTSPPEHHCICCHSCQHQLTNKSIKGHINKEAEGISCKKIWHKSDTHCCAMPVGGKQQHWFQVNRSREPGVHLCYVKCHRANKDHRVNGLHIDYD